MYILKIWFTLHDDVIKWRYFLRYWPFVRGIRRSPVNSMHKGQWRGALMLSLISAWMNGWVNNREAGDLGCNRTHYDVIAMLNFSSLYDNKNEILNHVSEIHGKKTVVRFNMTRVKCNVYIYHILISIHITKHVVFGFFIIGSFSSSRQQCSMKLQRKVIIILF